ncbi:MAG: YjbH domain-containing protein, partial [Rhodospirillales bacterium]
MLAVGAGPAMGQQSFEPSTSSWGGIGLIQTRNARFGVDGQMDFGAAYVLPYQRYFLNIRPLPWFEGTFRYTLSDNDR